MIIQTDNKELIVAIINRGFSEEVMDAARAAGATGGTIIHGRGTGAKHLEFYNMVLHEEKEAVLIIVDKEKRNAIMEAIMRTSGQTSEAQGIVFTLPVDEFALLKKEEKESKEEREESED